MIQRIFGLFEQVGILLGGKDQLKLFKKLDLEGFNAGIVQKDAPALPCQHSQGFAGGAGA